MLVLIAWRFTLKLSFLFYKYQPGDVDVDMLYLYGFVICLILTSTFTLLVFQLKKYHKRTYKDLRLNLWTFYLTEMIFVIIKFNPFGETSLYFIFLVAGYYPIL